MVTKISKGDLALAAETYIARGWVPIPLLPKSKKPALKGWPDLRVEKGRAKEHFKPANNIALLTGEPSGGLTDIDLDATAAVRVADDFLPDTALAHGRASKVRSHRYYVPVSPMKSEKFTDIDGVCIVEIRNGGLTMVPPSIHPSGEAVVWEKQGEPASVDSDALRRSVAYLATAVVLGRLWPGEGTRQDAALGVAGFLLSAGLPQADIARIVKAAASLAGDEEVDQREQAVASTAKAIAEMREVTGAPRLAELLVEGTKAVSRIRAFLDPKERSSLKEHSTHRPQIVVNRRFMRDISDDCLDAIVAANSPIPVVFQRGGHLVRLRDAKADAWVEPFDVPSLKGHLDRCADFVRLTENGSEPSRPPNDVLKDILALPATLLPEIDRISRVPVFLPTGRLLIRPGYDQETRTYLALNRLEGISSGMDLESAKQMILGDFLGDFHFADLDGVANTLACLLQPFLAPLVGSPTPLYLVEASRRGEGKGLLAQAIAQVTCGRPAGVMTQPRDEDEARKRITSLLIDGSPLVLLDNVYELKSGVLAAALTSEFWEDRLLGLNQKVRVQNDAIWLATGNNVVLSEEIARRVIAIRLDSGLEFPELRQGFKHQQLLLWIQENRVQIVSSCLSIVAAWVVAGMPEGRATLGSFEKWAKVMGGVMQVAGLEGFLSNRGRLYEEADAETGDWHSFTKSWWAEYSERAVTASDLLVVLRKSLLLLDVWGGRTELGAVQRVGHTLHNHRNRIYGEFAIRAAGRDAGTGNRAYRLERKTAKKTRETPETSLPVTESAGRRRTSDSSVSGVFGGAASTNTVGGDLVSSTCRLCPMIAIRERGEDEQWEEV